MLVEVRMPAIIVVVMVLMEEISRPSDTKIEAQ
jgi:hypothetical protein